MGLKRRSSAAAFVALDRDPTVVPGKPFLGHLYRVLIDDSDEIDLPAATFASKRKTNSNGASTRQLLINRHEASAKLELSINAPCLSYLQKLFYAMLTPTKSEYSGMIIQWRLNAAFSQQLEKNPSATLNLGAASPQHILQLAGRLLEVDTLHLEVLPSEVNLPMPSECDLLMFPKLNRLNLNGIDLDLVTGFSSIADTLTELHYANCTLDSLARLLARSLHAPEKKWRNLRTLRTDNVHLAHINVEAIALSPNLETVAFRRAGLLRFDGLVRCAWLSVIDLSHNHLHTIDLPAGSFEQLKVLNLSHNWISSIHSLQGCPNLETIDLEHNVILSLDNVQALATLRQLRSVTLLGNPVATLQTYRLNARRLLSDDVILDQVPWAAPDLDMLTRGSDTGRQRDPAIEEADQVNIIEIVSTPLRMNAWSTGRVILHSCIAIGFAQLIVSVVWSRDPEAERLTWWILAVTVCLGVVSIALVVSASSVFEMCRRKLEAPRNQQERSGIKGDSSMDQKSSMQAITRSFSTRLTLQEKHALTADSNATLQIDVLSESLQRAVRAGDDLTLLQLGVVCSQLKTLLAYFSHPDGDGIGFAWLQLNRTITNFDQNSSGDSRPEELVRDRLSSRAAQTLDAAESSTSLTTSLTTILPVLRLCAIMLSSIASESDSSQVLSDAYVQVFAARHPWWRQRSILAGITHAPGTLAFLEWLGSAHAHHHRHFIEALHKSGERLHFLHASLQELVDEHMHSFAHHFHPNL